MINEIIGHVTQELFEDKKAFRKYILGNRKSLKEGYPDCDVLIPTIQLQTKMDGTPDGCLVTFKIERKFPIFGELGD